MYRLIPTYLDSLWFLAFVFISILNFKTSKEEEEELIQKQKKQISLTRFRATQTGSIQIAILVKLFFFSWLQFVEHLLL